MNRMNTLSLLGISLLALSACSKDEATAAGSNSLLSYVPADTPYLYANLEPTPAAVVDAFLLRAEPGLQMLQTMLDDFSVTVNEDQEDMQHARLLAAVLAEIDGALNREGLESRGLSFSPDMALYGMGAFPVMRISLRDADALRTTVGRIESESGMNFNALQSGTQNYWRIADATGKSAAYLTILEDHAAIAVFPKSAEAEWLPAFLAQSQTGQAELVRSKLQALNKAYDFTGYGSGYFDLQAMTAEFLDGKSKTSGLLSDNFGYNPDQFGPQCVAEIKSIIAKTPRLVAGTTALSADHLAITYQLEMEPGLAAQLQELVSDVPVADRSPDKVLTASLAVNIGKLRSFLMDQATAIQAKPFQCEHFLSMNLQAENLLVQMNNPMPPFLGNLKGFRLSLDDLDYENLDPTKLQGMFSLEVEKPQMLIGMASMFMPGMEDLALEPGNDPVEFPQELMSIATGDMKVYVAMGKDSIGLAMGASSQGKLAEFLKAGGNNNGTFLSLEYDMAAQMEMQNNMQKKMLAMNPETTSEMDEMTRKMQEAYSKWLGRSRIEFSFNKQGMRIDNEMTFK